MEKSGLTKKIAQAIHKKDSGAVVYLFGSRARGDSHKDSDWDISFLVDDEKITNTIEDKFRDDLYDLELESGQVISTFIYPRSYWQNILIYSPLYKKVTKEGIRL